jgi:hypothetical protein
MTNSSQVKILRAMSMQMSFPETVSDSLCRNSDVDALGWRGYMWSAVVRLVGLTAKFSKTTIEVAYDREINVKFSGNSSGRHSCCQHANCMFPQNLRHHWSCFVV